MKLYKNLGHYFRAKRTEKGWLQQDVAEKAKIPIERYKTYELEVIPTPKDFQKIFKVLNLDEVVCRILLHQALDNITNIKEKTYEANINSELRVLENK